MVFVQVQSSRTCTRCDLTAVWQKVLKNQNVLRANLEKLYGKNLYGWGELFVLPLS